MSDRHEGRGFEGRGLEGPRFEGPVFEDNLRRLLEQAYVPVLPSPDFRRKLEGTFHAEARRRFAPAAPPRRLRRLPSLVAVAAAAAVLLFLLQQFAGPGHGPAVTPQELLARGEVAWRVDGGPWGPADPEASFGGTTLEVETPAARAQTIAVEGGRFSLGVAGRLGLADGDNGLTGELQAGSLELERAPIAAEPWRIQAGPAELRFHGGAAKVEVRGRAARFVLKAGRAELALEGTVRELVPGLPTVLDPATLLAAAADTDVPPRQPVAPEPPPPTAVEGPRVLPEAGLFGRVVAAPGESLPDHVEVAGGLRSSLARDRRAHDARRAARAAVWPDRRCGRRVLRDRAGGRRDPATRRGRGRRRGGHDRGGP